MTLRIMSRLDSLLIIILMGLSTLAFSQSTIRGTVVVEESGEPIAFGTLYLQGTAYGAITDINGFFNITGVSPGSYMLSVRYIGFDSISIPITLLDGQILNKALSMTESSIQLGTIEISGRKEQARTSVQISKLRITRKQITRLPSTGGDADIAQYLTVIPGVIISGDQGGRLFIRGGSPIQTKILLDGLTIYNPFHSIGFFSVFETDIIRSVDVLTGGFGAEHASRISAVVDIKTREGNRTKYGGSISASPFLSKVVLEGPLKKYRGPGTGSSSFILTGKYSYLDETSTSLYTHIEDPGLPYSFRDLYGKLSLATGNGSKVNIFGFSDKDDANFTGVSDFHWDSYGGGINFTLIPVASNFLVGGTVGFTNYSSIFEPFEQNERSSGINAFNASIDFTYFGASSEINYGIEVSGFSTDFRFVNTFGTTIDQDDNTTEIGGYFSIKNTIGNLILEPSLRLQYYASLSEISLEPRLGLKYNISDNLRFKAAGGVYSQNLISTVSERDLVNLFVGFLSGPEERLFNPDGEETSHRLQKAIHGILGVEIDVGELTFNVEPYVKDFSQLISLNRNKLKAIDPNFQTETGLAYGIDLSVSRTVGTWDIWATYSYAKVERDDGDQVYPTNFDRRHNVNFLTSYLFGNRQSWEASFRWNYGSGFPFTQTQGFYSNFNFEDGIQTDVVTGNADLGILFAEERNGGRLPDYHRLDISLKRHFWLSKDARFTATASVTNAYDRDNIFYFDRVRLSRVDQLPILPSLGLKFEW